MKTKTLQKELHRKFFYKNKLSLTVALCGALLTGSLNLIVSWIMQQLIDTASGVPTAHSLDDLALISAAFLLLCIVSSLLLYLSKPRFLRRAMRQYKDFAFKKLTEKGSSAFLTENTAEYLSSLTNDATVVESDYLAQMISLVTQSVTFLGALLMMFVYSPLMTGIAIGLTPLPFLSSMLTGGKLKAVQSRVSDRNRDFTAMLKDCLNGFLTVKSFQAEEAIFRLFSAQNRRLEDEKCAKGRIQCILGMIGSLTGIFAQLGVFLAGAYLSLTGYGLTAGTVILFVNLMNFIIEPIARLPELLAGRRAALGLVEKLATALQKNPPSHRGTFLPLLSQGIRLENLSFGYEEGKDVLHNISLTFEAGKAYAVVGASGSGKSTLLRLLMASFSHYRGNIFFDGLELGDIDTGALYNLMATVWQDVFVFNASVKDNITMFGNFPKQEIDRAIRLARLDSLIATRGINSCCQENGRGLSGGEKQRIAIARCLLKKASLLLADEATAALDAQTAWQVTDDILNLKDITRIIVTHNLEASLLRRYDGIIVLKNGHMEETGSFDTLMENKGYFYALYVTMHG